MTAEGQADVDAIRRTIAILDEAESSHLGLPASEGDTRANLVWLALHTAGRPWCTDWNARWCPRHGDCNCEPYPADYDTEGHCPLHGITTEHAMGPIELTPEARR